MTDPAQLPLRDIHLPEPVSWWPPPPGWWLALGAALLCIGLGMWLYRRHRRKSLSAAYLARIELRALRARLEGGGDAGLLVRDLSVLLRRLSISLHPRAEAAGLTGEDWLRHLDQPMPGRPFTTGVGRILIEAPYRPQARSEDAATLLRLCETWVDAVARRPSFKPGEPKHDTV